MVAHHNAPTRLVANAEPLISTMAGTRYTRVTALILLLLLISKAGTTDNSETPLQFLQLVPLNSTANHIVNIPGNQNKNENLSNFQRFKHSAHSTVIPDEHVGVNSPVHSIKSQDIQELHQNLHPPIQSNTNIFRSNLLFLNSSANSRSKITVPYSIVTSKSNSTQTLTSSNSGTDSSRRSRLRKVIKRRLTFHQSENLDTLKLTRQIESLNERQDRAHSFKHLHQNPPNLIRENVSPHRPENGIGSSNERQEGRRFLKHLRHNVQSSKREIINQVNITLISVKDQIMHSNLQRASESLLSNQDNLHHDNNNNNNTEYSFGKKLSLPKSKYVHQRSHTGGLKTKRKAGQQRFQDQHKSTSINTRSESERIHQRKFLNESSNNESGKFQRWSVQSDFISSNRKSQNESEEAHNRSISFQYPDRAHKLTLNTKESQENITDQKQWPDTRRLKPKLTPRTTPNDTNLKPQSVWHNAHEPGINRVKAQRRIVSNRVQQSLRRKSHSLTPKSNQNNPEINFRINSRRVPELKLNDGKPRRRMMSSKKQQNIQRHVHNSTPIAAQRDVEIIPQSVSHSVHFGPTDASVIALLTDLARLQAFKRPERQIRFKSTYQELPAGLVVSWWGQKDENKDRAIIENFGAVHNHGIGKSLGTGKDVNGNNVNRHREKYLDRNIFNSEGELLRTNLNPERTKGFNIDIYDGGDGSDFNRHNLREDANFSRNNTGDIHFDRNNLNEGENVFGQSILESRGDQNFNNNTINGEEDKVGREFKDSELSYFIQVDVVDPPASSVALDRLPKGTLIYFPPEPFSLPLPTPVASKSIVQKTKSAQSTSKSAHQTTISTHTGITSKLGQSVFKSAQSNPISAHSNAFLNSPFTSIISAMVPKNPQTPFANSKTSSSGFSSLMTMKDNSKSTSSLDNALGFMTPSSKPFISSSSSLTSTISSLTSSFPAKSRYNSLTSLFSLPTSHSGPSPLISSHPSSSPTPLSTYPYFLPSNDSFPSNTSFESASTTAKADTFKDQLRSPVNADFSFGIKQKGPSIFSSKSVMPSTTPAVFVSSNLQSTTPLSNVPLSTTHVPSKLQVSSTPVITVSPNVSIPKSSTSTKFTSPNIFFSFTKNYKNPTGTPPNLMVNSPVNTAIQSKSVVPEFVYTTTQSPKQSFSLAVGSGSKANGITTMVVGEANFNQNSLIQNQRFTFLSSTNNDQQTFTHESQNVDNINKPVSRFRNMERFYNTNKQRSSISNKNSPKSLNVNFRQTIQSISTPLFSQQGGRRGRGKGEVERCGGGGGKRKQSGKMERGSIKFVINNEKTEGGSIFIVGSPDRTQLFRTKVGNRRTQPGYARTREGKNRSNTGQGRSRNINVGNMGTPQQTPRAGQNGRKAGQNGKKAGQNKTNTRPIHRTQNIVLSRTKVGQKRTALAQNLTNTGQGRTNAEQLSRRGHNDLPRTSFTCPIPEVPPGYYADNEAGCKVFHVCWGGGRRAAFMCPQGTLFNQELLVCDWEYNVECTGG